MLQARSQRILRRVPGPGNTRAWKSLVVVHGSWAFDRSLEDWYAVTRETPHSEATAQASSTH